MMMALPFHRMKFIQTLQNCTANLLLSTKTWAIFIRETKDILTQLCDDFERTLRESQNQKPITEQAEGHIYIDTRKYPTGRSCIDAYASFAEALGFTITDEGTFEKALG